VVTDGCLRGNDRRAAFSAAIVIACLAYLVAFAGRAAAAGGTVLPSCTGTALQNAVTAGGTWIDTCTTIFVSTPVVVGSGKSVEFSGQGSNATIDGSPDGAFTVAGGSLTIAHLTVEGLSDSSSPQTPGAGGASMSPPAA
jgi:hypothetical protein